MADSMLEKVRKLLAKAEDPGCTPEEAAALNDKAAELIAKYGVDRALLASYGDARDEVADRIMTLPDPYARQKADLLVRVASPLRVLVAFNVGLSQTIKGFRVHMFGYASDIERVEILFTSLLVQAANGMAKVHPGRGSRNSVAAFRRDWMAGFGIKVYQRLKEAEERAVQQAVREGTTGMDLVLVNRNDAVSKALELAYPDIVQHRARVIRNERAYRDGARAGANADLGGTRIEATTSRTT